MAVFMPFFILLRRTITDSDNLKPLIYGVIVVNLHNQQTSYWENQRLTFPDSQEFFLWPLCSMAMVIVPPFTWLTLITQPHWFRTQPRLSKLLNSTEKSARTKVGSLVSRTACDNCSSSSGLGKQIALATITAYAKTIFQFSHRSSCWVFTPASVLGAFTCKRWIFLNNVSK